MEYSVLQIRALLSDPCAITTKESASDRTLGIRLDRGLRRRVANPIKL